MKVTYCDNCGKVIKSNEPFAFAFVHIFSKDGKEFPVKQVDLCAECCRTLPFIKPTQTKIKELDD